MRTDATGSWKSLFERDYIKDRILDITDKYPEVSSLQLSCKELQAFDIWDLLIKYPDEVLDQGKRCLAQEIEDLSLKDNPNIPADQLLIRLTDGDLRIAINEIRQQHIGRIVELKGIVRRCSCREAMIVRASFRCKRCGQEFNQYLHDRQFIEPANCANTSCGRGGPFELLEDRSLFVDMQKLVIQETFDELDDGRKVPQSIEAMIRGDIVNQAQPGDRIRIVGILRQEQKQSGRRKLSTFVSYLDCLYLEHEGTDYRQVEITEADRDFIFEEASRPDHIERMIQSIAPSLHGLESVKLGLLLQQVGGCTSELPDTSISRGEIHILLAGDPSVGKSILLQYLSKLSPRCAMGTGGGASGVGITASVVKDDQDGWILEAGVMPMANRGLAIIDEFDKLGDADKGMLHDALEKLEIHIDKAGIHAVLPTRCSLLAAANPKLGRFDELETVSSQINLTPPLMSRFDLIFVILDKPDLTRDRLISQHILEGAKNVHPPLDMLSLRKFLAFAREIKPRMTEAASKRVQEYYISLRQNPVNGDSISIHPRALQSIRRLAEANAKLRLSGEVTEEDAATAISVHRRAFKPLLSTDDGELDVDIVDLGISQLSRDMTRIIKKIIRNLSSDGGATLSKIMNESDRCSIPKKDAIEVLARLKKTGDVMELRPGLFAVAE